MGKIISLVEYKKKKEEDNKTKKEKDAVQAFLNHAKTLKW